VARIEVGAGAGAYPVEVGRGLREEIPARLQELSGGAGCLVIADSNTAGLVGAYLAAALRARIHVVPAGERSKSFAELERAVEAALDAGLDRRGVIVAVGGGVVGDLAGVVAATYMRGVRLVHVPTTLLAMVDSAIGGKAAIDVPRAKNLVGAFKPPAVVFVDPDLLRTLPEREYRSGLAEVAKYSMISDEHLFDTLLAEAERVLHRELDLLTTVIERCCAIKAGVVTRDEHEAGERAILNYGHTVGHALEAATGYGPLTHGEAVAVGMTAAAEIGAAAGVTPAVVVERQGALLDALHLPRTAPGVATAGDVLALLAHDKKAAAGQPRWVLIEAVGRATWGHSVPVPVVEAAVAHALEAG